MKAHAEIQRSAQPARIIQPFFQRNKSNPFYSSNAIQLKPVLGKPNDSYEQEADRVADAVVEGKNATTTTEGISTLQRKCSNCQEEEKVQAKFFTQTDSIQRQNEAEEEEALQAKPLDNVQRKGEEEEEAAQAKPLDQVQRVSEEEEEAVQTKLLPGAEVLQKQAEEEEEAAQAKSMTNSPATVSNSFASQLSASSGNGSSLPKSVQAKMSNHIGADFSNVRIHTNSQAAEMSQSIQAKAFTHGNNIYFNKGQYNPETKTGQHLLAHELTHTVQQGAVRRMVQRDLAVAPSTPNRAENNLSPEQVSAALHYNLDRFSNHEELRLIRDVIGLTPNADHLIDEQFVRAIASWQASHGLNQDGKLGRATVASLVAEYRGEARLVPEMGESARRLNLRTKSDERKNNITVNGHPNLFDAILSHRNALLKLLMRINFRFHPDASGTAMSGPDQNSFVSRFKREVLRVWSFMYGLIPASRRLYRNYLDRYFATIAIQNTATNPHYVAHVTRTANQYDSTNPPGPIAAGGPAANQTNRWLRIGSSDTGLFRGQSRGGFRMRQYTTSHEFGHMLGLPHIHCNTNSNDCYGVNRAERANIMGLGNRVTRNNYLPFITAMHSITGKRWRAR